MLSTKAHQIPTKKNKGPPIDSSKKQRSVNRPNKLQILKFDIFSLVSSFVKVLYGTRFDVVIIHTVFTLFSIRIVRFKKMIEKYCFVLILSRFNMCRPI
jgi:hypothetical protein